MINLKHSPVLILIFIAVSFFPKHAVAEQWQILSGRVVDADTKKPILATLYLDNTTSSTVTKSDGSYRIENIRSGKYNLVVNFNDQLTTYPISFTDQPIVLNIEIKQYTGPENSVANKDDVSHSKKYFRIFRNYLLGNTPNNESCLVINREAIILVYNKKEMVFKAFASKPIEIVNQSLGYRLFLSLKDFEINYQKNTFVFLGTLRFEAMKAANKPQENRWENHREIAFYGSLTHFMRSLINHELSENHFSIYHFTADKQERQIDEKELLTGNKNNQINPIGDVKIIFNGQLQDRLYAQTLKSINRAPMQRTSTAPQVLGGNYLPNFVGTPYFRQSTTSIYQDVWPGPSLFQISYLHFGADSITVYENGYFENINSVRLDGYWAYRECLSNALPLDYQPAKPLTRLNQ